MKYAMMWLLSLLYNHSMVRLLFLRLLIAETMLGQIFVPEFFGVDDKVHFLMVDVIDTGQLVAIKGHKTAIDTSLVALQPLSSYYH